MTDKIIDKQSKTNFDLFDNPMVRSILKQMSPEEVQEYKQIGQELYGNIDFEKSEALANLPPPMSEGLAYIKVGLRSGLLPTDLDESELALLVDVYGKEWYLKFGFTEDDVKDLKTPPIEDKLNAKFDAINDISDINDPNSKKNKKKKNKKQEGPMGIEDFNPTGEESHEELKRMFMDQLTQQIFQKK